MKLLIWDSATDDEDAEVIDLQPGERYVFDDHFYAVALAEGAAVGRFANVTKQASPQRLSYFWPF
jgi:hypothetical protein